MQKRTDSFFLCCVLVCSVERDRLREREKQARAQMSSLVAERDLDHQDGGGAPLFGAPVKVSSSSSSGGDLIVFLVTRFVWIKCKVVAPLH